MVGAMPVNGTSNDIFWKTVRFKRIKATIDSVTIFFGGVKAGEDVVVLPDEPVVAAWTADGDVASYFVNILDSMSRTVYSQQGGQTTSYEIGPDSINPGEVYTLQVGAMPINGTMIDIVWKTAKFTRIKKGLIKNITISFNGTVVNEDIVTFPEGDVTASWAAEGDVDSYCFSIADSQGQSIISREFVQITEYLIGSDAIHEDETYTLKVGAMPTNGKEEDIVWKIALFKREAAEGDFVIANGVITGYKGAGGDVVIPTKDSKGNPVIAIGVSAFAGNTRITSVSIPASVTTLGVSSFEGCSNLKSVVIPNGVATMAKAAFKNCEKLVRMSTFG